MKRFMRGFMNHEEIYYPDVSVAWVLNFSSKRETHRPQNLKDHCQSAFWQNHTEGGDRLNKAAEGGHGNLHFWESKQYGIVPVSRSAIPAPAPAPASVALWPLCLGTSVNGCFSMSPLLALLPRTLTFPKHTEARWLPFLSEFANTNWLAHQCPIPLSDLLKYTSVNWGTLP